MNLPLSDLLVNFSIEDGYHRARIIKFIEKGESIQNEGLDFIVRLAHAANEIPKIDTNAFVGRYRRIYEINMEGAERCVHKLEKEENPTLRRVLLSTRVRLLKYAGRAAKSGYNNTRDMEAAMKWYGSDLMAAEIQKEIEGTESAHIEYSDMFNHAGLAAMNLYKSTRMLSWAKRWYYHTRLSADLITQSLPKVAMDRYKLAGDAAFTVYTENSSKKWRDFAIECYKKYLDYVKGIDSKEADTTVVKKRMEHLMAKCIVT